VCSLTADSTTKMFKTLRKTAAPASKTVKKGTTVKKVATVKKAAPKKAAPKTVKKAAPKKAAPPPSIDSDNPLKKVFQALPTGTPGATQLNRAPGPVVQSAGAPSFAKPTPVRTKTDLTSWYGPARKLYLPGGLLETADIPAYLDGSLAGDYGFDPLRLGKDKEQVEIYREYELIHARWAMLGTAGCFFPDALGVKGAFWQETGKVLLDGDTLNWTAPPFISIENPLPLPAILAIQIGLMGAAENFRSSGEGPAGFVPNFGEFTESDLAGKDKLNPGGPLDFLGFATDPDEFELLKVKEIKNGRLAMVTMLAFTFQGLATGEGPYSNWAKHVIDPFQSCNHVPTRLSLSGLALNFCRCRLLLGESLRCNLLFELLLAAAALASALSTSSDAISSAASSAAAAAAMSAAYRCSYNAAVCACASAACPSASAVRLRSRLASSGFCCSTASLAFNSRMMPSRSMSMSARAGRRSGTGIGAIPDACGIVAPYLQVLSSACNSARALVCSCLLASTFVRFNFAYSLLILSRCFLPAVSYSLFPAASSDATSGMLPCSMSFTVRASATCMVRPPRCSASRSPRTL